MCRLFHCCFKATHQQDSRWSWVVCICATISQMMFLGILRSFGVLFPTLMKELQTTRERTAWVSSLALSLTMFAAPVMGHLSEKFGCRLVTLVGMLSGIVGLVATSFVNNIEVMFFTYGILVGLGACCGRTSCFLVVAKYFNKKRSFATGSVTMGPSLGVFMWGPVVQVLLDSVGWRNTFRIMALGCCLVILLSITFNPNVEEKDKTLEEDVNDRENTEQNTGNDKAKLQVRKEKVAVLDLSVFRIPQYCILVVSFTLMFMCRFIPNIHLIKYSEELNISASKSSQYYMLLGGSSAAARILVGRLCDIKWINIRFVNQLGITITGVATCLLPLARSFTSVVFYSAVFGFTDGAFITSQNVILLGIVGPERRASAFGFGTMLCSFAVASGPPLAGLIADKLGSYEFAFYAAGAMMLLSSAVQFLLLCFKSHDEGNRTRKELVSVENPEKTSEIRSPCKDHKEHLVSLYLESAL